VELPSKAPVVAALLKHGFAGGELVPSTRPIGCSESWVAYLAGCIPQRLCREAPPIAAGERHSSFLGASSQVLACGEGIAVGQGDAEAYGDPTPVAVLTGIRVWSVAAGMYHSLALTWDDGRVYSWGYNCYGQLGLGDRQYRPSPALVPGLEGVSSMDADHTRSIALTQSGSVFHWGHTLLFDSLGRAPRPDPRRRVRGRACVPRACRTDWILRHRPGRRAILVGEWPRRASRPHRHSRPDLAEARRGAAGRAGEQRLTWGHQFHGAGGGWAGVHMGSELRKGSLGQPGRQERAAADAG
jgi:hypothetical protein